MDKTIAIESERARYRDIIVLRNRLGKIVHTCNYVITANTNEIIVLSKDGSGPTIPLRLRNLTSVISDYSRDNPELKIEYRREFALIIPPEESQ